MRRPRLTSFRMPAFGLRQQSRRAVERSQEQLSSMRTFAGTTPGSRLLLFVLVSALAGVLVAGAMLPFVGSMGLVAKAGAETFQDLPGELATPPLGEKSVLLARDGTPLATYYEFDANRRVVPLSEISPWMQQAVVAIEDSRFYEHGGIDLKGTLRAMVSSSGDEVQGGSTLTQQYVKNVLIEKAIAEGDDDAAKAARVRTRDAAGYARKLRELRYAADLEQQLTKDQILERYLNIAYFGNGTYGVETAAQRYFSKSAKDLDLREAALLAGFVRNPSAYDPFKRPADAKDRRDVVINRMVETGKVTPEQGVETKRLSLGLNRSKDASGCNNNSAGFFCDYIRRLVSDNPVFGETPEDRRELLFRGGLTIKSTLDPKMQKAAQDALAKRIFPTDPVVGTAVTVEPGTGQIRAMAISREFGEGPNQEEINYAGDNETGGSQGISPGSTFKIFAAAIALEQGFGLEHQISSPYQLSIPDVKRCPDLKTVENYHPIEGYNPRNERTDESGTYDMRSAFAKSINTYFLQLQGQIKDGICPIAQLTDELGLRRASDGGPLDQRSDFSIGRNEVSPTAMAAAYAAFPARGKFCAPIAVTEVLDRNGKPLPIPSANCKQVIPANVADAVNEMGKSSVLPGGTGVSAKLDDGREQAGKTGTNERQTVWYIGYTPNLTTAVAVYKPHARTAADKQLSGFKIGGISPQNGNWGGYNLPAPIWKLAMDPMVKEVAPDKFVPMDPKFENGTKDPQVKKPTDSATTGAQPGESTPSSSASPKATTRSGTTATPKPTKTRGNGNGRGNGGRGNG